MWEDSDAVSILTWERASINRGEFINSSRCHSNAMLEAD